MSSYISGLIERSATEMTIATTPIELDVNEKLERFCKIHNISSDLLNDLKKATGWRFIFIADDSGSMTKSLDSGKMRWEELEENFFTQIELANCYGEDGCDIYFLNREPARNIKTKADISDAFSSPPCGCTPLAKAIKKVIHENFHGTERLLIIIGTDGKPSDIFLDDSFKLVNSRNAYGKDDIKKRQDYIRFQFMACTDEPRDVEYLNEMDEDIPGVDTTDDYESERLEAKDKENFNRGTYVAKSLLGPILKKYDEID